MLLTAAISLKLSPLSNSMATCSSVLVSDHSLYCSWMTFARLCLATMTGAGIRLLGVEAIDSISAFKRLFEFFWRHIFKLNIAINMNEVLTSSSSRFIWAKLAPFA